MNSILFNDAGGAPGTILKDIRFFLQFIQEHQLEITGNRGLLPNHCLPAINAGMSHPLKLQLKREQQISYPHIAGLYLISRTLGILQITQNKSKRYLTINEQLFNEWAQLNSTEQFFNLMQAWLFRSDGDLINRGSSHIFSIFNDAFNFIQNRLKADIIIKNPKDQSGKLYCIKLYNLALLGLFGMVNIENYNGSPENTWLISRVSITEFGKKMSSLLTNQSEFLFSVMDDEEEGSAQFYQKLAPIFPAWRICMTPETKKTDPGTHTFKISLTKKIWRRISIQGSEPWDTLVYSILKAFDFDCDHLYRFTYVDRFGASRAIYHSYMDDGPYTDEFKIGDIDILIGDSIEFLYDFGDSWTFDIQLESIDVKVVRRPTLIDAVGEAPEQYPAYEESDYS